MVNLQIEKKRTNTVCLVGNGIVQHLMTTGLGLEKKIAVTTEARQKKTLINGYVIISFTHWHRECILKGNQFSVTSGSNGRRKRRRRRKNHAQLDQKVFWFAFLMLITGRGLEFVKKKKKKKKTRM